MFHERTVSAAKGKWRGILMHLGVPESVLVNKHGPCPLCASKDNFRFDNREGSGSWICTCAAGDGMALAIAFTGKDFRTIAPEIDAITGNVTPDTIKRPISDDDVRKALRKAWVDTTPISAGDVAMRYLASRGLGDDRLPAALRFGHCTDGEGGLRPTMLAVLSDPEGKPCTLHRTFLRPDGSAKADMDKPRKMMPGPIALGASVRLSEWTGGSLGVAEGIETALSAARLFELPVWAATSADLLRKWQWPDDVEDITIFGDNDTKFAGQAAAWVLAHRIAVKNVPVIVKIPETPKTDWNDILLQRRRA